jgi:hypothetical protein
MFSWRAYRKAVRGWSCLTSTTPEAERQQLDDPLGQLECWALSLPWVQRAATLAGHDDIRGFAVVCPPLGCHSVWLSIGDAGLGTQGFQVHVVVTRELANRGAAIGWAHPLVDLTSDRVVVGVATPTQLTELSALQSLLGLAYNAVFHPDPELAQ